MSRYLTSPGWNRPRGLRAQALRFFEFTVSLLRNVIDQARDDLRELDPSRLLRCVVVGVALGIMSVLLLFIAAMR